MIRKLSTRYAQREQITPGPELAAEIAARRAAEAQQERREEREREEGKQSKGKPKHKRAKKAPVVPVLPSPEDFQASDARGHPDTDLTRGTELFKYIRVMIGTLSTHFHNDPIVCTFMHALQELCVR